MFTLKKDNEIGKYIKKLIDNKYKSTRQFCKDYLIASKIEPTDEELSKMSVRMSAIKKGTKAIQIKDLPVFTMLLDVSSEQILSAGDVRSFNENHMTNYQIAFSHKEKLWEVFINDDKTPFLNPDEYDKTVIDYALELKNYDLLKYLMDNGYIRFVSKTPEKDCWLGFGAETSVKRRQDSNFKTLEERLAEDDGLRRKMIVLAIEKGDIVMLDELRAREIPPMYRLRTAGNKATDFEKFYDADMVEALSKSDESVLDYFSKEITVVTNFKNTPQKYMFPSIGILLEKLIANKNKCIEAILKRCIEHNRNTYYFVKEIAERQIDYYHRCYFDYFKDGNIISVLDSQRRNRDDAKDGIVTNIIRVNIQSDSFVVSDLIHELNKYFDDILALNPEKGENNVF